MDARKLKDRLYARHPGSGGQMPGPWTCVEEWRGIDLLAFSAWQSAGKYARVGYEVKVSRSDLRRELLKPSKRARNVNWCNEFYFAVPAGLLTDDEIAFEQPDWKPEDFARTPCRYSNRGAETPAWNADPSPCRKGKRETLLVGPLTRWRSHRPQMEIPCDGCGGKGYEERSLVEREGPTLWIPPDVGLILVDGRGTRLVKASPRRKEVPTLSAGELGQFVRYVSMRPDPRHHVRAMRHVGVAA